MTGRSASTLLSGAFKVGYAGREGIHRRWISASLQIGSRLQRSALMISIQRIGRIDLLLRAIESEAPSRDFDSDLTAFDYQHMMSEVWVLLAYEAARTVRQRKIGPVNEKADNAFRRLEIVRMVIAKHEIASDRELKTPLVLERRPSNAEDLPATYDRNDPLRAHIAPAGLSERGSVGWWAIDTKVGGAALWVERQQLSDDLLAAWNAGADMKTSPHETGS